MTAVEEDTELRDLLIQNLENSGVLNKIKAELRAAVFLALEEQEKVEKKTPLFNESLKKFLNTKDGRLVASLLSDFLQFFNLDFTMAVFQPEINTLLESRDAVARELGIPETEATKGAPLLLELMKRGRHKDRGSSFAEGDRAVHIPKELSPKHIAEARKRFDHYDKDRSGEISKEELKILFTDLFPHFHKSMLERYITDEFRALDKGFNNSIAFDQFLGMYKCLFIQCRSVVTNDICDIVQTPSKFLEEKLNSTLESKAIESSHGELSLPIGGVTNKSNVQISASESKLDSKRNSNIPAIKKGEDFGLDDEKDEGDSFFDDPLPKPEKTYGRTDSSRPMGSLAPLSDAPPLKTGLVSLAGVPPLKGPYDSNGKVIELKDLKTMNEKIGSFGLGDKDDDYDDFNSISRRSDKTKSEVSIGEEIEEELSIEGVDFNASDELDDLTLDRSISQFSEAIDYMEEVA
ncbi:centrosomal protein 43-like isoform X6 [Polyodon spathula]|uniref:centrosomal protein 43-like isoform X6 n=1 Tax=Polyodon spathula TaxID=7913 RepID=UPI001B7F043E|nr:centrosomal protein 43-like isoform X6 [Polyodon spathula]